MKVLVVLKANEDSEAGKMPSEKLISEMMKFNEELVKSGIMLAAEGLHPSSKSKRVRFVGNTRSVIDGPFSETKELIAGYWIWQVKSMDEAVELVKRIPNPDDDPGPSDVDIRPIFELDDFAQDFSPELKAQEQKLRDAVERQQKQ